MDSPPSPFPLAIALPPRYTPPMHDTKAPKPRITTTRASTPSIALALGGGGARGIAHIPMLPLNVG